jgi:hypothetical protein
MISKTGNSKPLLIIIAVLLLANLFGLAYFIFNKPTHNKNGASDKRNAMAGYLKNDIGFTPAQLLAYDSLTARHKRAMTAMFDTLRKEKDNRLKYISQFGFADTAIKTAVAKTAGTQEMLEVKMLMHLKDVRNICTGEQKIKFDTSIYKVFSKKPDKKK